MANDAAEVVLSTRELREITGYAARSAQDVLQIPGGGRVGELIRALGKALR